MNSGLNGTTRNTACQAAKNSTTASAAEQRLAVALAERLARRAHRRLELAVWRSVWSVIGYTVISSLSVFQISSFRSLNSGVTRIS